MTRNQPTIVNFGAGIGRNSYRSTVGRMQVSLANQYGYETQAVTGYKPVRAWSAHQRSVKRVGQVILESVKPNTDYICHSWHANPLKWAMEQGLNLRTIIMFSPSINANADFTVCNFDKLVCVYNPKDIAIFAGEIFDKIAMITDHPFGSAGRTGFSSAGRTDKRISNIPSFSRSGYFNHSFYFRGEHLADWSAYAHKVLRATEVGNA